MGWEWLFRTHFSCFPLYSGTFNEMPLLHLDSIRGHTWRTDCLESLDCKLLQSLVFKRFHSRSTTLGSSALLHSRINLGKHHILRQMYFVHSSLMAANYLYRQGVKAVAGFINVEKRNTDYTITTIRPYY